MTVVSASSANATDLEAHSALAARSSRGAHITAGDGGHYVTTRIRIWVRLVLAAAAAAG